MISKGYGFSVRGLLRIPGRAGFSPLSAAGSVGKRKPDSVSAGGPDRVVGPNGPVNF
jgi:hypothetical protein